MEEIEEKEKEKKKEDSIHGICSISHQLYKKHILAVVLHVPFVIPEEVWQ